MTSVRMWIRELRESEQISEPANVNLWSFNMSNKGSYYNVQYLKTAMKTKPKAVGNWMMSAMYLILDFSYVYHFKFRPKRPCIIPRCRIVTGVCFVSFRFPKWFHKTIINLKNSFWMTKRVTKDFFFFFLTLLFITLIYV